MPSFHGSIIQDNNAINHDDISNTHEQTIQSNPDGSKIKNAVAALSKKNQPEPTYHAPRHSKIALEQPLPTSHYLN